MQDIDHSTSLPRQAPHGSIAELADRVRSLSGWRRAAVTAAAGAVSILGFAPFHFSPVLFVTLPVLVWAIEGRHAADKPNLLSVSWRAGVAGWWFGFGFHLAGLYWIGHAFLVQADQFAWLLPFAVTLLPVGLALFHGIAGAVSGLVLAWLGRSNEGGRCPGFGAAILPVLVLALSLGTTEWLRGHIFTGFPWNLIGYALAWPLVLMQSASLIGTYGLTLLAPVVFASPLVVLASREWTGAGQWRRLCFGGGLAALILGGATTYGLARLADPEPEPAQSIRLRLVQPSIAQDDKWKAEKQREIFEEHVRLSAVGEDGRPDGLAAITHVIWAEASMPFMPLESPEAIERIGALLPAGTRLIAGSLRRDYDTAGKLRVFNSLIVFGEDGRLEGLYDKIHLVPFGEYLPFQEHLDAIGLRALVGQRGGFASGDMPRPIIRPAGLVPALALICYEAVFPAQVVQGSERPQLLINVTNDGWFGQSIGPYQHYHQSRLRAVEEGLPMVRVANNGISAVIDGKGRILKALALDEKGVIDSHVPGASEATSFTAFRQGWFWVIWLILLTGALFAAGKLRYRSLRSSR